jgi:predicted AlkP superfamily pyrophosphatase or phosphodiesterase
VRSASFARGLCLCAALAALLGVAPLFGQAPLFEQAQPFGQAARAERPVAAIRRALIVSVDGLRPDLLLRGPAPHMRALMNQGSYTLWARTVEEVYTVPSHVSMLTGVTPTRHGVTWDNHIEDSYPEVPTLFELARRAGYTTAIATGKSKFVVLTKPGTLNWSYLADEDSENDADVARRAVAMIRDHRPDVLFVHFGSFDKVGHASGWGSPEQMRALKRADDAFGLVQQALTRGRLAESTVTILTADHGGAGLLHPPEDVRSQFIPWIVAGPSIRRNFDLASVPGLAVDTMATFATVAALLGIDPEQPVDGKPVLQILEQRK